ncbi:MAG: rRNA maturation RNase YbeY [Zoogloeaceae bacterium]|jgi:probable rRNA maturation factor|nr:rRNA maturation RNase YbeY [Zoogloeaceae bacterium]
MKTGIGKGEDSMEEAPDSRLRLCVQYACGRAGLPTLRQFRHWAGAALLAGEVTIRLVSPAEGRALNKTYRNRDYATNVLSFPYETVPEIQGDLAICPEVVAREAAEQGKNPDAHYAHLVIHGMLHLQGWDHESDAEAFRMEAREREILARLDYPDPYV